MPRLPNRLLASLLLLFTCLASACGDDDAIRISDAARYSGATLAVPTRLERDADTIALWQLDEGAGATAADETTFMRDGTIRGAAWVPSDR